jgi:hypothetical protein
MSIMRITAFVVPALLISSATAQPLSPRLASLIPPDSLLVYSINLERYANSALQSFYPVAGESSGHCLHQLHRMIIAERTPSAGGSLTIFIGPSLVPDCTRTHETSDTDPNITPSLIVLEGGTAISGDRATVQRAIERWKQNAGPGNSDLWAKVGRMIETYDNWLIAVRPFYGAAEGEPNGPHSSYRSQFTNLVEEVRAGVRLGRINEVRAEVEMKTAEDAIAAAGLGRWLRGFVQVRSWGAEAALAEVAENLSVTAAGNIVSLSFTIDSAKVLELAEQQRAKEKALAATEGREP